MATKYCDQCGKDLLSMNPHSIVFPDDSSESFCSIHCQDKYELE